MKKIIVSLGFAATTILAAQAQETTPQTGSANTYAANAATRSDGASAGPDRSGQ